MGCRRSQSVGRQNLDWQRALAQHWGEVRFGDLQGETTAHQYVFQTRVYLGAPDPEAVQVELYANSPDRAAPLRTVMARGERLNDVNAHVYSARVLAARPAVDYTPRIMLHYPEAAVPLEAVQIFWQLYEEFDQSAEGWHLRDQLRAGKGLYD